MKAIILDFLERWIGVYLPVLGIQFLLLLFAPAEMGRSALLLSLVSTAIMFVGDFAKGTPRVCRALPLARRDLTNSWRLLAVIAPSLQFAAVFLCATALRAILGLGNLVPLSLATLWVTMGLCWSGICFRLIDQTNTTLRQSYWRRVLKGLVFVGGFIFLLNFPENRNEIRPWHGLFFAGVAVEAMTGWWGAEARMVRRGSQAFGNANARLKNPPSPAKTLWLNRPDGIPFFLLKVTLNEFLISGSSIFLLVAFSVYLRMGNGEDWSVETARFLKNADYWWAIFLGPKFSNQPLLAVIRHMRSLPIQGKHLTLLVSALSLIPFCIFMAILGAIQAFFRPDFQITQWLSSPLMLSSAILFPTTWALLYGNTAPTTLGSIACVLVGLALFFVGFQTPFFIAILVSLSGLIAGGWLIHGAVCKESQTYRITATWPKGT